MNIDRAELDKFSALAHRWWDPNSEFKPLHQINPLRLGWIDRLSGGLAGKRVIDIGCGGGILSESMARLGAQVTGIDLAEKPLKVAQLHALDAGVSVDYQAIAAEDLAQMTPASFDVVTCMEMLEHVPDPASTV
ncbi:MAG: 3-demethylubiquinone-9 3-O-methyltransferase, partial [Burkholderiales bacterium]|nr:3-demethylubiquinone-9 3-O-methyltransferase [Burkholderiales bacterium]